MSTSLSSALSAMLSHGEEANENERNEKLEAAALNVSKLLASVRSGKADPSVLDGLINGDFGSGSATSSSSSALPASASSTGPKLTELSDRISKTPEPEKTAGFSLTILDGVKTNGQQHAVLMIAQEKPGYEVDARTGDLKAVRDRDKEIRDLQEALAIVESVSGINRITSESYKDHARRMADEFKKLSAASSSSSSSTPATAALPKSIDPIKLKATITAAKDLLEKGKPNKGMFGKHDEWVVNGSNKDKVLKDLTNTEKAL